MTAMSGSDALQANENAQSTLAMESGLGKVEINFHRSDTHLKGSRTFTATEAVISSGCKS
jgi:hypothetical protein